MTMPLHATDKWCWRCDREPVHLVRDPIMPPGDRIGVCQECAVKRAALPPAFHQRAASR